MLFQGLSSGLKLRMDAHVLVFSANTKKNQLLHRLSLILCDEKPKKMWSWVENLFCSQEEIIAVSGRRRQKKKKKNMFCFSDHRATFSWITETETTNLHCKNLQLFSSASKNVCLTNTARLFLSKPSSAHTVHKTWRWLYLPFLKCDCQFCHILSETLPANDNMCS